MTSPTALRFLQEHVSEQPPGGSDRAARRPSDSAGADERTGAGTSADIDIAIDGFVVDWQLSLVTGPTR